MRPVRVVLLVALTVFSHGCGSEPGDAADPDASDGVDDVQRAWFPVAPTSTAAAAQGAQDVLETRDSDDLHCSNANVVLTMQAEATCYAGTGGELRCAGQIGETNFGQTFTPAGIDGVVQQVTSGANTHDAAGRPLGGMCVLREDGTAWCYGRYIDAGQFRTADGSQPGREWKQWGTRSDIVELSSSALNNVCARYADGTADCVGLVGGASHREPLDLGADIESMWIDGNSIVHVNDPEVFRGGNQISMCVVTTLGMACKPGPNMLEGYLFQNGGVETPRGWLYSPAEHEGAVVDGNQASEESVCWLTSAGEAWCLEGWEPLDDELSGEPVDPEAPPALRQYFADVGAIALGVSVYAWGRERCVVGNDGSVWCIGQNVFGHLGTGDAEPLVEAVQVQPPGSARIQCANAERNEPAAAYSPR